MEIPSPAINPLAESLRSWERWGDEGLSPWTTDCDQISLEFASPWVTAVCPDHCRPTTRFSRSIFERWGRQRAAGDVGEMSLICASDAMVG